MCSSDLVRTLRQVLMVVVDPEGKIRRVELLAFAEPTEFIPNARWYGQFVGKALDETLSLKRDIKGVTGATLTARATTQAVRRVLATHAVLHPAPNEKAPPKHRSQIYRTGRESGKRVELAGAPILKKINT